MSKPKIINELNKAINVFAEIDGRGRVGIGPNDESEISNSSELEFAKYDLKSDVKVIIEVDKMPNNTDGEGFKYAFGESMGRAPHHIEVKRKGNDFTLIIHYMKKDKEDVDPAIKHPD
ncbi:MAG: hypothetical protein ABJH08_02610 [Balneola sp.]